MRHFLPFLLIGLGGCSLPALGTTLDDYADARYGGTARYYQGYGEPLRASVWFDEYTGYASFDLNRPAHVAVFALQPMGGLRMVYPAIGYGSRQLFSGGSHFVQTGSYRNQYSSGWSFFGSGTTPTYIVLIASERPLDVGSFMATGSMPWLSRAAVTWNPYMATEVLAREIVPSPDRTDWTVAYHVIWPNGRGADPRYRRAYTWIVCPGNVMISVPVEAVRNGWVYCPDGQLPDRRRNPDLPKITDALPRRPPPGWMGPRERGDGPRVATREGLGRRPDLPGGSDSVDVRLPWRRPVTEIDLGTDARRLPVATGRPEPGSQDPVREGAPRRPESTPAPTARPERQPTRTVPTRAVPTSPAATPSKPATPTRPAARSGRPASPTKARPTRPTSGSSPAAGSRPSSGSRPTAGSRPSSGSRPTAGSRPSSGSRPTAGSRPTGGSRPAAKPARPATRPTARPPARPKPKKKPKGGG